MNQLFKTKIADIKTLALDVDLTVTHLFSNDFLPGITSFFSELDPKLSIVLISNQGGVGYRQWLKKTSPEDKITIAKYPTQEHAMMRLICLASEISKLAKREIRIFTAFSYELDDGTWTPTPFNARHDPRWLHSWRKPFAGMLAACAHTTKSQPGEILFSGDKTSDQKAANLFGCLFLPAPDLPNFNLNKVIIPTTPGPLLPTLTNLIEITVSNSHDRNLVQKVQIRLNNKLQCLLNNKGKWLPIVPNQKIPDECRLHGRLLLQMFEAAVANDKK